MTGLRRDLAFRVTAALLLGAAALALFLLGGGPTRPARATSRAEIDRITRGLDTGIDSVLSGFHIDIAAVRKREIPISEDGLARIERRVGIPPAIVPVMINTALNDMAKPFGARAVASENVRSNTVTIHIEFGGVVYHTVVLRTDPRVKMSATPSLPRSI